MPPGATRWGSVGRPIVNVKERGHARGRSLGSIRACGACSVAIVFPDRMRPTGSNCSSHPGMAKPTSVHAVNSSMRRRNSGISPVTKAFQAAGCQSSTQTAAPTTSRSDPGSTARNSRNPSGTTSLPRLASETTPAEFLQLADPLREQPSLQLAPHDLHGGVDPRLPDRRGPQRQAAGPLLGEHQPGAAGEQGVEKLRRDRQPMPLVERSHELADQQFGGRGNSHARNVPRNSTCQPPRHLSTGRLARSRGLIPERACNP